MNDIGRRNPQPHGLAGAHRDVVRRETAILRYTRQPRSMTRIPAARMRQLCTTNSPTGSAISSANTMPNAIRSPPRRPCRRRLRHCLCTSGQIEGKQPQRHDDTEADHRQGRSRRLAESLRRLKSHEDRHNQIRPASRGVEGTGPAPGIGSPAHRGRSQQVPAPPHRIGQRPTMHTRNSRGQTRARTRPTRPIPMARAPVAYSTKRRDGGSTVAVAAPASRPTRSPALTASQKRPGSDEKDEDKKRRCVAEPGRRSYVARGVLQRSPRANQHGGIEHRTRQHDEALICLVEPGGRR